MNLTKISNELPEMDWHGYFAGHWRMARRIVDRRSRRRGEAVGDAQFAAGRDSDGASLICRETLTIDYGGQRWPGHQETIWRFENQRGPQLYFSNGRPFCEMAFERSDDLWRAIFTHLCGDDIYEGEASLVSANAWRLIWRVAGPRKDYTLDTEYRRIGDNG